MTHTCKNCDEMLQGKFCHNCGEKIIEKNDFSLNTLVGQFVDGVFNIDSKLYKSFFYLLFKPGKLTSNYIEGIRKPFMKPIQLFLISNILFFLLLTQADILRMPAKYFFNSGRNLNIEVKMSETNQSASEIMQRYDKISTDLSKSLVIIIVPIFALGLYILNFKSKFLYGMHLIFSMHYLAFFFLCCLLAVTVSFFGNKMVQLFLVVVNFVYLFFAIRQVYQNSIILSVFKSIILVTMFYFVIVLYNMVISYVSYNFV